MKYNKVSSGKEFDLSMFPKGEISKFWLHIINNGLGEPIRVPILVARGLKDGPVFGASFCREVLVHWCLQREGKIGGEGKIVEIDESKIW